MADSVAQIYWLSGGSAKLDEFPWADIEKPPVEIKISSFENTDAERKRILEAVKDEDASIVVFDLEDEEQFKEVESFFNSCPENTAIVILVPLSILDHVSRIERKSCYIVQKPIRKLEFFLLLEKMVLLRYYKAQTEKLGQSERDLINRVEQVFEFSRKEMLDRERTTHAYEKLVEYEEHLLEEQRRINQALMSLQEYRDQEKIDWERERNAREAIEEIRREELQTKDQTVQAQESLIEFHRNEKLAYFRLLKQFEEKGTLDTGALEELFAEHKKLIATVQSLPKA